MTENKSISAEQVPTEKEIELVGLIARDMRPMEIAEQLDLSNKTVEAQIFSLKRKFAKKTNAGLVFLFMQNQLIG